MRLNIKSTNLLIRSTARAVAVGGLVAGLGVVGLSGTASASSQPSTQVATSSGYIYVGHFSDALSCRVILGSNPAKLAAGGECVYRDWEWTIRLPDWYPPWL